MVDNIKENFIVKSNEDENGYVRIWTNFIHQIY